MERNMPETGRVEKQNHREVKPGARKGKKARSEERSRPPRVGDGDRKKLRPLEAEGPERTAHQEGQGPGQGHSRQFLNDLGAEQFLLHLVRQCLHPAQVIPEAAQRLLPGLAALPPGPLPPQLHLGLRLWLHFCLASCTEQVHSSQGPPLSPPGTQYLVQSRCSTKAGFIRALVGREGVEGRPACFNHLASIDCVFHAPPCWGDGE